MKEEKLYTKEDFINYCEHPEPLVRNWAFEHLTRLYPEAEVTVKYLLEFLPEAELDRDLKYIIFAYLRNNYNSISGDKIYSCLDEELDIDIKAFLLNILAQKGYQPEEVLNTILSILETGEASLNAYLELQNALTNLGSEKAYQRLRAMNPNLKLDDLYIESYLSNLIKFEKSELIEEIMQKIFRNLDKLNYNNIFQKLSNLFYGNEFSYYLCNFFNWIGDIEEIMEELKRYWPENKGVKELNSLIAGDGLAVLKENPYGDRYNYLMDSILAELDSRYSFELNRDNLDLTLLNSERDEMSKEDFWIGIILSTMEKERNHLLKKKDEFFLLYLLSIWIVLLEELNFEAAIAKARADDEYLWELFVLDRNDLSKEVVALVLEKIDLFADRIIALVKDDKYGNRVIRAVKVLSDANCQEALPYIIDLFDSEQGDFICEAAEKALKKMNNIPIEMLIEVISKGDFTAVIYLSSVLECYPYERVAEFFIELWEDGELDHEQFIYGLKRVGSEQGLTYLSGVDFQGRKLVPEYLAETLIILAIINQREENLDLYRELLARSREERINNFDFQFGEDSFDSSDEYKRNSNGAIVRTTEKVGRNDPCPCGSGKKYKKCCDR